MTNCCLPDPINTKPDSPLTDPLVQAQEEKEKNKRQEKDKDCLTNYYPPSPIYEASYEEDVPALVNNLVPELTMREKETQIRQGR